MRELVSTRQHPVGAGQPHIACDLSGKLEPMAKASEEKSTPTRLAITPKVMRELLLASGGRCAMERCGDPLISATRGWIGTVAHIVGAEEGAPRGKSHLTPEERRGYDNLILMCANHGREVDAPGTGEANFPVAMLKALKAAHEQKITGAIEGAINQELRGYATAEGLLDTSPRKASTALTGAGLADALLTDGSDATSSQIVDALKECRDRLQRLSEPALEALAQVLDVWVLTVVRDHDFGDPGGPPASIPVSNVHNRLSRLGDEQWVSVYQELANQGFLDYDEDSAEYDLCFPCEFWADGRSHDFWRLSADFLHSAHGLSIGGWLRSGLDFSIYDEIAPPERPVPWR